MNEGWGAYRAADATGDAEAHLDYAFRIGAGPGESRIEILTGKVAELTDRVTKIEAKPGI
jgi:hypothetical protein